MLNMMIEDNDDIWFLPGGGPPCNKAHSHLFLNQELRIRQARSWHDPWIRRTKVKRRATKSQERVALVMMARGNQLEDIEEHDDENFLLYYVFLEAYRMLSYFSSFVCVLCNFS